MSRDLFNARGEHIHSPVDDLESFFWVAVWSVFFNETGGESHEAEAEIRQALLDNRKAEAMDDFLMLIGDEERNDVTRRFQDIIECWWKVIRDRNFEWREEVTTQTPIGAGDE